MTRRGGPIRYKQRFTADGTGVMAETLTVANFQYELYEIRLHLSAAGGVAAENFTATLDSVAGSEYDNLLFSQDMDAATDVIQTYDPPLEFALLDTIDFAWANANGRTWGLEVLFLQEN